MVHSAIGLIHFAAACTALALGLIVLLVRKGTRLHRALGYSWVFTMITANAAALSIYQLTGHFEPFHALALLSLACIFTGLSAALFRWRGWLRVHLRFMAYSYLGLLAAATAEIATRTALVRFQTATGVIAFGLGVGVLFTVLGRVAVMRLQRAARVLEG